MTNIRGHRPRTRLTAAVAAGKMAGMLSRRLGRGGTALPGLVAERIAPDLVEELGGQLGRGAVLITGTNGKTTTSRMLAAILAAAGIPSLHNREGSNLMRGIAATLLGRASPRGRLRDAGGLLGLFETDEATLPAATRALQPRAVAFTNLFRDQLDRYGEVDTVAAFWREAIAALPPACTLVLNADDPSVADLSLAWGGPVHWFGVDDPTAAAGDAGAVDARWCGACNADFAYDRRHFAHVGWWRCTGCGRARPAPDTAAARIALGLEGAAVAVPGLGEITLPVTGWYNVYNALAAAAVARVLGLPPGAIRTGLAAVRPAFGRQETAVLDGRRLHLLLAKNPAGANQVLRLLAGLAACSNVAVLLNDRFADGQDVSWIWDVDYELLAGRVTRPWAGGDRAEDMALRLKYAGWPPAPAIPEPGALLDAILAAVPPGEDVFLIPTYTAMLDLREALRRRGAVARFFEQ